MEPLLIASIVLSVLTFLLLLAVLKRSKPADLSSLNTAVDDLEKGQERFGGLLREEMAAGRKETERHSRELREEMLQLMTRLAQTQEAKLQGFAERQQSSARQLREEVQGQMVNLSARQQSQLEAFSKQLAGLVESNEKKFDALKLVVEQKLAALQEDNGKRLDEMRKTVDEKLQGTLEKRLGESFKLVSERLEQVYKGLGEMQALASGVGDLKKVLTNVKTRGTWGEVLLGNLLEQVLIPDQYAANVQISPARGERVEYAICLPGKDDADGQSVWLPIDSKFPKEDFERLVEAAERADSAGVEEAARQLEMRLRASARDIHEKYICPPYSTDFAIMFLPCESLYAEALRRPGLVEQLQSQYQVVLSGPTTLAALLNSLQMGFRTLAIQKRSSEVWKILGAVKTEFGKFGGVIDKVRKKLDSARNEIDNVGVRTRAIQRKLRTAEELPSIQSEMLLQIEQNGSLEEDEEELPLELAEEEV